MALDLYFMGFNRNIQGWLSKPKGCRIITFQYVKVFLAIKYLTEENFFISTPTRSNKPLLHWFSAVQTSLILSEKHVSCTLRKLHFFTLHCFFSDCVHNVVFLDRSHCCIDFPREMPLLAGYDICSGFLGVIYSCLLNEKCQLDVSSLYSSRCWLRHIGVDWRFHISLTQGGYEAEISTFQWYLTAKLLIAHFFVNMFVNYLLCQFSRGNAKFPQRMLCKVFSEGFSSGSSFPDTKWYNMP